jgi:hypothetical protein
MSGERPRSQKTKLALAIANGASIAAWARGNEAPKRTAYRLSREPLVMRTVQKKEVELPSHKMRAMNRRRSESLCFISADSKEKRCGPYPFMVGICPIQYPTNLPNHDRL